MTHGHAGHSHSHGHGRRRRKHRRGAGAHAHGHAHTHRPRPTDARSTRALTWALVLTVFILIVQGVGGWLSNSLALLADAGHVLTDAGALGLSLFVAWLARQPGSSAKTYGYLRWEIIAALINGATLIGISLWIVYEAVMRFRQPEAVAGGTMLIAAALGLVVNAVAVGLLHAVREGSLNVHGAYLHVLGDMLASGGTLVAALVIKVTGWTQADPIASLLTTVLILFGSWRLVRESVDVLLEASPSHIAPDVVRSTLESIPNVESVHDLHIWTVTSGMIAMSAHAVVRESEQHQTVLERAHDLLTEMGIQHCTIQIERQDMLERERHGHP